MAEVISDVDPGGGGDYTSLSSWWSAKNSGSNAEQTANCFDGKCDEGVNFNSHSFSPVPTASVHPRVVCDASVAHDGTYGNHTSSPYIETGGFSYAVNIGAIEYFDIDGIVIRFTSGNTPGIQHGSGIPSNAVHRVDNVLGAATVSTNDTVGYLVYSVSFGFGSTAADIYLRNCAVVRASTSVRGAGLYRLNHTNANLPNIYLINNSMPDDGSGTTRTYGIDISSTSASATVDVVAQNNAVYGAATGCFRKTGSATFNHTHSYNASSDATADDWGATGALINRTASTDFDTVNTSIAILSSGGLDDAGTDTSGYGVTTDALGTSRSGTYDIGAYEIASAGGRANFLTLLGVA